MTYQARTLVNGQWATRTMRIDYVLSQDKPPSESDCPTNGPPSLGLLSRTLIHSPLVKCILPARIRHKDKNDVIFVHETSIEIKEFVDGRYLQEVTWKTDFGSSIQAARILGVQRKPYAMVEPEGDALEAIIKQELSEPTEFMEVQLQHAQIPPQILVMVLRRDQKDSLVFAFAYHRPDDRVHFVTHQRPLPRPTEKRHRLGAHLAVDPQSRALAVAAHEGNLMIYALKSREELQAGIALDGDLSEHDFQFIKEERHLQIDGVILKIEFLHPNNGDANTVILLVVVSINQNTRLLRFDWDVERELRFIEQPWRDFPVPEASRSLLLLIPFTICTGFILVCETTMIIYTNILAGYSTPTFLPLLTDSDRKQLGPLLNEPGRSKTPPLWTAWARPIRRPGWVDKHEELFLCREDGVVTFMEFDADRLHERTRSHVGQLDTTIDTAFAALDSGIGGFGDDDGRGSYDMIVTDRGLFMFQARKDGELVQSMPHWTPIRDIVTAPSPSQAAGLSLSTFSGTRMSPTKQDRIFACTGQGNDHGALCEMCYGVEAPAIMQMAIHAPFEQHWLLPNAPNKELCMLLTDEDSTVISYLPRDEQQVSEQTFNDLVDLVIDTSARTVDATITHDRILIQITNQSLRAITASTELYLQNVNSRWIVKASIEGRTSSVLIAAIREGTTALYYTTLTIGNASIHVAESSPLDGEGLPLGAEPSCLLLQFIFDHHYAFVATWEGKIQVFIATHDRGLRLIDEFILPGDTPVCESMAINRVRLQGREEYQCFLLCGLRTGTLTMLRMKLAVDDPVLLLTGHEEFSLGTAPVSVVPDTKFSSGPYQISSRSIITCGEELCRLTYRSTGNTCRAVMQRVYLTRNAQSSIRGPAIRTVAQCQPWNTGRSPNVYSDALFCLGPAKLEVVHLDPSLEARTVPRHIMLSGEPTRVIFSERMRVLIVAVTHTVVKDFAPSNGHHVPASKQRIYSKLRIVDPNRGQQKDAREGEDLEIKNIPQSNDNDTVVGYSMERILGLMEWSVNLSGKIFHFIAVNTRRPQKGSGSNTGRVYLYKIATGDGGKMSLDLKETIKCDAPVYAMAAYDDCSIVICCGHDLHLRSLIIRDDNSIAWRITAVCSLQAEARHVSVAVPYIYVSTHHKSLLVFKFENGVLGPYFSDQKARPGLSHMLLPEKSVIITTNLDGVMTGLRQSPRRRADNSLEALFEFKLPGTIVRLRRPQSKPPWTRSKPDRGSIIGATLDGALYQFDLLEEPQWRLLRFVQNMAEQDENICPITCKNFQRRNIEPSTTIGSNMHVDGDILNRLLDCGSPDCASLLRAMLRRGPSPTHRYYDFETAEQREDLLTELARAALGEVEDNDIIEAVLQFIATMLEPAI